MPGDFVPHIRIMNTGYQTASLGNLFGLPYVVMRKPTPIDTTTLNYNWQIWETNAFSIYTKETDEVDEQSAQEAVAAVLRYLSRVGLLRYTATAGICPPSCRKTRWQMYSPRRAGSSAASWSRDRKWSMVRKWA